MTTNVNQPTLYEQLGKQEGISAVVDDFYERVLADPLLKPVFASTDMDQLRRHQAAFITFAVGGPNNYNGRNMQKAHEGLNITPEQFQAVAHHLTESLKKFDVADEAITKVINTVASLKDDVIGK